MWRLQLFGGLQAHSGDRVVSRFRTEKTASLFAYLAFHPDRTHSREVLAEIFWPDADPDSARHSLRLALSSLRQQFSTPDQSSSLILTDRRTAQLDSSRFQTDVHEFEDALTLAQNTQNAEQKADFVERAVELYTGELLQGFYDSWLIPHQQRLQQAFLRAALDLAVSYELAGDVQKASTVLARAVSEDPLSEDLQLMRLRLALKDSKASMAVEVYREIETLWRDQLDETVPNSIRMLEAQLPRRTLLPRPNRQAQASTKRRPPPSPKEVHTPPSERVTGSSSFIGRREEIAAILDMLKPLQGKSSSSGSKLVTLTGPGGTGKTRLAEELFDRLSGQFPQSSWIVRLADVHDPALIPSAMHSSMKLAFVKDVPPLEAVQRTLSARPALLVLDNLEQLLPDGASMLRSILATAPQLICLATSRRATELPHEREFPVLPLPTPTRRESIDLLQRVPSVELFVERAQRAKPDFHLTPKNAPEVAELCGRLEGMPLAIELAASRSYALSPAQILDKLSDRYELLAGRDMTLDARHRTMRAAVAWSYDLLSPEARALFRSLSVFHGGWTVEAAAAVHTADQTEALLEELRSSSLIVRNPLVGSERFDMLDTLRDYAARQLTVDERKAACHSHLKYFANFALSQSQYLTGPDQARSVSRLTADLENFRVALDRSEQMDPASGLQIAAGIWRIWLALGLLSEGRSQISKLLELSAQTPPPILAVALFGAGVLAAEQSDYRSAQSFFEKSLAVSRSQGDRVREGGTLNALGNVAREMGDHTGARKYYDDALQVRRSVNDLTGVAGTLTNLANVLLYLGDFEDAIRLAQEALAMKRNAGNPYGEAASVEIIGICARGLGDYEQAERQHRESLAINTRIGSRHGIAGSLHNLAVAQMRLGYPEEAREHLVDALSVNRELGHTAWVAYNLNILSALDQQCGDVCGARDKAMESLEIRQKINEPRDLAASLERFANLAAATNRPVSAARLLGAANKLRTESKAARYADEREDCEQVLAHIEKAIGIYATQNEMAAGAELSLEDALAEARQI